jgi:hypothetical protein
MVVSGLIDASAALPPGKKFKPRFLFLGVNLNRHVFVMPIRKEVIQFLFACVTDVPAWLCGFT